jgi:hypothetical protein
MQVQAWMAAFSVQFAAGALSAQRRHSAADRERALEDDNTLSAQGCLSSASVEKYCLGQLGLFFSQLCHTRPGTNKFSTGVREAMIVLYRLVTLRAFMASLSEDRYSLEVHTTFSFVFRLG